MASYRLSRGSISRLSEAGILPPRRIEVDADGSAVVFYSEQPLAQYRSLDALQKIVEYQARFVDPGAGSVIANVIIDLNQVIAIRWGAQDAGLHRAA